MLQTLSLLIPLIYIDTDIKFTGNAAKPDSSFRPHLDTACDFWSRSTRQTSVYWREFSHGSLRWSGAGELAL